MEFEMKIGLNEGYMLKLFKIHERYGSNKGISDVIEDCLKKGIDREIKENGSQRKTIHRRT